MTREYENYVEPEPVKEPAGPTPEELAAQKTRELEERAHRNEIEAAKSRAKAEAMEQFVQQQFAQGRQAPQEAVKAQEDLGLTEEQILEDPAKAIALMAEHIQRQRAEMSEYQKRSAGVISTLAKANFKTEMTSLSKERYSEWVMPYVEDYFKRNPEEAFQEGRVKSVYNELVGQNVEELERLHREKTSTPSQRERVVEPSMQFSSHQPTQPKEDKPNLADDEDFFRQAFNNDPAFARYAMSEEEWAEIRQGRKFPKKIATDIQVRGAKPNVSY